ncbi:MAG: hypothetical protein CVV10_08535 [Gammaproteobacteria bacterium HGW-Gammaproteobacteria-14]|nr:MAG: hypothetical protein CVV10_08535 [Gammaproteobacteria bacterium HGW-Gammaproteobacteria-14]
MWEYSFDLLFRSNGGDLTSREKYLLACLIFAFPGGVSDESVLDLSSRFGIPTRKLIEARNGLLNKGLIVIESVRIGTHVDQLAHGLQGRPRKGIRVHWVRMEELFAAGSAIEAPAGVKGGSCAQRRYEAYYFLFSGAAASADRVSGVRLKKNKGLGDRLNVEAIVILAVLWAHASDQGVVTGLGRSEIGGLAGVTLAQVMNIERKLVRLGYIESWRPGRSCKGLFGVAPGMVFLSAKVLPARKNAVQEGPPIQVSSKVVSEFKCLVDSAAKVRDSERALESAGNGRRNPRRELNAYLVCCNDFWSLVCRFHPYEDSTEAVAAGSALLDAADLKGVLASIWQDRVRFDQILKDSASSVACRYQIDRLVTYASELVSAAPGRLDAKPEVEVLKGLIGRIRNDAVQSRSSIEPPQKDWVARLLFGIVWALAVEMQEAIRIAESRFGEMEGGIRVIPSVSHKYVIHLWPV